MKNLSFKLLLGLLFIFPFSLFSQHCLESGLNMYRADDLLLKQQVEYKDPGRMGEGVLWDFSKLSVVSKDYEVSYFLSLRNPQLMDDGLVDPETIDETDCFLTGMEHRTRYNYTQEGDSLLLWGFENATTLMRNSQPEVLFRFPVSYGDSIKSYYYGHGKYGNRLELDAMALPSLCRPILMMKSEGW